MRQASAADLHALPVATAHPAGQDRWPSQAEPCHCPAATLESSAAIVHSASRFLVVSAASHADLKRVWDLPHIHPRTNKNGLKWIHSKW